MKTLEQSVSDIINDVYGFISHEDLSVLAVNESSRLFPVTVRCGRGRFLCGAQDAKWMMDAIEKAGDYVRDVSVDIYSFKAKFGLLARKHHPFVASRFNESDCSGSFDGFGVVSDADPGL